MKLLIVLPISQADVPLAQSLVACLKTLGGCQEHSLLIVADKGLPKESYQPLIDASKPVFAMGQMIFTDLSGLPNWPHAYNHRFECAARLVAAKFQTPFLWLDPRCVPMHRGWLRQIEEEYFARRKPFMGQALTPDKNGTAQNLISAVGVYPAIIPKRMQQRLIAQRGVEFEKSCADLVFPDAHATALIWTQPSNGQIPVCLPSDVPPKTALAHTPAALMLASALRGEPVVKPPPPAVVESSTPAPKPPEPQLAETPLRSAYYHSGNLGDVIYALYAIKLAGGGKLFLGPKQRKTSLCSSPIKEESYAMLAPLLAVQPYLSGCKYYDHHPGTDAAFDLNTFRDNWDNKELRAKVRATTLAAMHAYTVGVYEKFKQDETWLTIPEPIKTGLFTIHRSARYRNEAFPWQQVVKRYGKNLLFIGLPSEHASFQREMGIRCAFFQCSDFLQMARVIAGSIGFIGNQSFPCAIALGIGQRVLQESWSEAADCAFARNNFLTQPFTEKHMMEWESK